MGANQVGSEELRGASCPAPRATTQTQRDSGGDGWAAGWCPGAQDGASSLFLGYVAPRSFTSSVSRTGISSPYKFFL